jgi:hypothetical protein
MSKKTQVLANSKQLEEFTVELVNLDWRNAGAISRFKRRFPDSGLFDSRVIFAFMATLQTGIMDSDPALGAAFTQFIYEYFVEVFQAAWAEHDSKAREWIWAILRTQLARDTVTGLFIPSADQHGRMTFPRPPEELPVERAFDYLLENHNRTRYCPNEGCPAPYFFAKRHTQRYCSESCAQNGERETKRRWWAEHGVKWRKARTPNVKTSKMTKKQTKATKGK